MLIEEIREWKLLYRKANTESKRQGSIPTDIERYPRPWELADLTDDD